MVAVVPRRSLHPAQRLSHAQSVLKRSQRYSPAIVESPELRRSSPLKMTQSGVDQPRQKPRKAQYNQRLRPASRTPPRTRTCRPTFVPYVPTSPLSVVVARSIVPSVTSHSSSSSSRPSWPSRSLRRPLPTPRRRREMGWCRRRRRRHRHRRRCSGRHHIQYIMGMYIRTLVICPVPFSSISTVTHAMNSLNASTDASTHPLKITK